jgi:hypothetical protein
MSTYEPVANRPRSSHEFKVHNQVDDVEGYEQEGQPPVASTSASQVGDKETYVGSYENKGRQVHPGHGVKKVAQGSLRCPSGWQILFCDTAVVSHQM